MDAIHPFGFIISECSTGQALFEAGVLEEAAAPESFTSLVIENDDDRSAQIAEESVVVLHAMAAFLGTIAETDGFTLDGDIDVDGWIELLMNTSDVVGGGILEGDPITVDGASYTVNKIDNIGSGMSALYLVP